MKTFGDIKKGDKLYVVNTGTSIPGGVEIITHEALSDYTDDLSYHNTTLFGVMVENPFGDDMPLCFNRDASSSGMYFTTIEEAHQKAVEVADKKLKEYEDGIATCLNKIFETHAQIIMLKLKKESWSDLRSE